MTRLAVSASARAVSARCRLWSRSCSRRIRSSAERSSDSPRRVTSVISDCTTAGRLPWARASAASATDSIPTDSRRDSTNAPVPLMISRTSPTPAIAIIELRSGSSTTSRGTTTAAVQPENGARLKAR